MAFLTDNSQLFTQLFAELSNAMMQNRSLDEMELTQLQGMTLRSINKHSGLTMTALAKQIGVTKSQLTRIVDTLEDRGLVQRVHNADNHRVVNVEKTVAGVQLIQQNIQAVAQRYERQLRTLGSQEQAQLIADLQNALDLLNKAGILRDTLPK